MNWIFLFTICQLFVGHTALLTRCHHLPSCEEPDVDKGELSDTTLAFRCLFPPNPPIILPHNFKRSPIHSMPLPQRRLFEGLPMGDNDNGNNDNELSGQCEEQLLEVLLIINGGIIQLCETRPLRTSFVINKSFNSVFKFGYQPSQSLQSRI